MCEQEGKEDKLAEICKRARRIAVVETEIRAALYASFKERKYVAKLRRPLAQKQYIFIIIITINNIFNN